MTSAEWFCRLQPMQRTLGVLLASLILVGCKNEAVPNVDAPAPIRVVIVAAEGISTTHRYTGVVRARYETDLGFRIGGKITTRLVSVGDTVRKDQVLAVIDDTDLKLQRESFDAQLASAKTSLATAKANLKRQQRLKEGGWASQARLDEATSVADEAQSRMTQIQRQIDILRNQISYTQLTANFDGVITAVPSEAGEVVGAGQPAFRLARSDALDAVINVPEQQLDMTIAAKATAALWPERSGDSFPVTLRETAAEANAETRSFEIRYGITDPAPDIRLGKTVTVTLQKTHPTSVIRLPLSAVMNDAKGPMVWAVNARGDAIARRSVTVQAFQQDSVIIASGIAPGERVVALGVHLLDQNRRVRIVESGTSETGLTNPAVSGLAP